MLSYWENNSDTRTIKEIKEATYFDRILLTIWIIIFSLGIIFKNLILPEKILTGAWAEKIFILIIHFVISFTLSSIITFYIKKIYIKIRRKL